MIYKLVTSAEWEQALARGRFDGSEVDLRDGFIHFSGPDQVVETAARHFVGRTGLTLLAVDPQVLGDDLRWETSRDGLPFPHLYAPLSTEAVVAAVALPEGLPVPDAVAALLS